MSVASPAEAGELNRVVTKPHWSAIRCRSLLNLKLQVMEVRKVMIPLRSAHTTNANPKTNATTRLTLMFVLKIVSQKFSITSALVAWHHAMLHLIISNVILVKHINTFPFSSDSEEKRYISSKNQLKV